MRIFVASLATESNTFVSVPTGFAAYRDFAYFPAGTHPEAMSIFAGPLWAARKCAAERNWQVVEGLVAAAQPGGKTTRGAYESLREQLLTDLRNALPVDVVALGLHGAMVAEGYDDCEGDILKRAREIVGAGVVIGAELDLHNHLSAAMVHYADILVSFMEYPHTDIAERGLCLLDLCESQALGKIAPVASVVDCQMISIIHTTREPARSFIKRIKALEGRGDILSISITHGFPWGDTPDMGTKVLVYSNNNGTAGDLLAMKIADELISLREALNPEYPDIDSAIDQAIAASPGPIVLADGADNPGGGAPGDSTFILRRLIERGIRNAAVGPLSDPGAVKIAFDAGVGATLPLRIGGKTSPSSGQPLDLNCTVKALIENMNMTGVGGEASPLGDCVLVESSGIEIVLSSLRNQAMNTDLFTQLGCDLLAKRIIVVKSMQHFYASFSSLARAVIYVGAPGALSFDWDTLPYDKIKRPKWPLREHQGSRQAIL